MPDEIERKLIDKRVASRYLKKGWLDEKEYDKHLKSLPDLSDQALPIEAVIEFEALELDDDDSLATATAAPQTAPQAAATPAPAPVSAPQDAAPAAPPQMPPPSTDGTPGA